MNEYITFIGKNHWSEFSMNNEEIAEYPDESYQIIADAKQQFEMTTDLFGDGVASLLDIKEFLNDQTSMYENWRLELVSNNDELQLHAVYKKGVEIRDVLPSRHLDWVKVNNRCYYVVIGNLVE